FIADGVLVLVRVVAVNAVDVPRRLEEDVGLQLAGAEGGGGVGGDERVASAAREDDDAALLQVARRPAADVRLGDVLHADRGLQARLAVEALQGVLERQAVEDGGEHAHVVGRALLDDGAVAELVAAQQVAAADDDGQLHAALDDALRLPGDAQCLVDADAGLAGLAEPLAAELQEDALVLGTQRIGAALIVHGGTLSLGTVDYLNRHYTGVPTCGAGRQARRSKRADENEPRPSGSAPGAP